MISFLEIFGRVVKPLGVNELSNLSPEEQQLISLRNDPFIQALFPQKQVGRVLAICLQILFNDQYQK